MPDAGCLVPDAGTRDAGCLVPDAGTRDAGCRVPGVLLPRGNGFSVLRIFLTMEARGQKPEARGQKREAGRPY